MLLWSLWVLDPESLDLFLVIAGLGDSGGPALVAEDSLAEAYAFLVLGFDVSYNAEIDDRSNVTEKN